MQRICKYNLLTGEYSYFFVEKEIASAVLFGLNSSHYDERGRVIPRPYTYQFA